MKQRTEQVIVNPNTATLENLQPGAKNFGQCLCPFCNQPNIVAGPDKGVGTLWVFEGCGHNLGTAATDKDFEISVLFRGEKLYSEIP